MNTMYDARKISDVMAEIWNKSASTKISNELQTLLESLDTPEKWLRFIMAYASWNSCFGNGISALTAKVGSHAEIFMDTSFPRVVADRSNYVASFIFEAAHEKFDDALRAHRDSNRCLGQTTLLGLADYYQLDLDHLKEPLWLKTLQQNVMHGYLGVTSFEPSSDVLPGEVALQIFSAMGYHWAAEQLATLEFPMILENLKNVDDGIMPALSTYQIGFAGGYHHGDTWFHQGTSDRHIVQAEKAIDLALSFTNMNLVQRGKQMVSHGISRLLMDHEMLLRKIQSDVSNIS